MAQYTEYTDPITGLKVREGIRNGYSVVDVQVTDTGFAGSENIDWVNVESEDFYSLNGQELVTNAAFGGSAAWELRAGHSISNNKFNINCSGFQFSNQWLYGLTAGHHYLIKFIADEISSGGNIAVHIGATAPWFLTSPGVFYRLHTAVSDFNVYIQNSEPTVGSLTLASVKEII